MASKATVWQTPTDKRSRQREGIRLQTDDEMTVIRVTGLWCVLVTLIGLSGQAVGEEEAQEGQPEITAANVNRSDVYVNDNLEASDAVAAARRLTRRGRWVEAARLLQRTSDEFGDKLIRVSPGHYRGIREHIATILSDWPSAGLKAYRDLYERNIRDALDPQAASRTVDDLLPLFERYFCTTAAAELADLIGQLAIESGDLALARRVYRRVLDRHPAHAAYDARYAAMLTLIAAIEGRADPEFDDVIAGQRIRWMGEPRDIAQIARTIRESFRHTGVEPAPNEWPIFGGDPQRNRRASCHVDEIGLLWRFHMDEPPIAELDEEDFDGSFLNGDEPASAFSIHPVISGDLVVIQWLREVIALRRGTGTEQWQFSADVGTTYDYDEFDEHPSGWDSPTVHNGRVYAAFPGNMTPYYTYESSQSGTELICLDLRTGEEIWRTGRDDAGAQFAETYFDSSPIVTDGRLFVVARRRRSFGFEDCYLYRLNTDDGTVEWRTHLGSASTGSFSSRRSTMSIPALGDDTVYVCTNLGSVAAVSAHTGAVRWLRLYSRDRMDEDRLSGWFAMDVKPWEVNPVLRSGGRIICFPTDTDKLLVLDEQDGHLVKAVRTETLERIMTVLGVRGNRLCGVGDVALCFDLDSETVLWASPLPDDDPLGGRGAWVDDRLLVPTLNGLSSFRATDGQRTDMAWDSEGGPGNLLALGDQVLVAGVGHITAYARKSDIWSSLRQRMKANPSDPLPALELAEVALGGGETTTALAALDEAVRRAERAPVSLEPTFEARLFRNVVNFAQSLSARSTEKPPSLDKLFEYASRFAPEPSDHVEHRLAFGVLFERYNQPADAVRLYQQILKDRFLRELPSDPANPRSRTAAGEAQRRIARLIEERGRDIYEPHEAEAARLLEGARQTADETTFVRIIEAFPNSKTAPVALIAHGDLLRARDRAGEAAGKYAVAYHRYPKEVDRPALMRKIADSYERAGRLEHAYRWLTKAAREYPHVLIEDDGQSVTFGEYRERLAHVRGKVEPSRPNLTVPLTRHSKRDFGEQCLLLAPRFGEAPVSDWSRYYVHTRDGVRAFDARTNNELWFAPAPSRVHADLLVAAAEVVVLSTPYEVFALDAATGQPRWSHGEYPAHLDMDNMDWEEGNSLRTISLHDSRMVTVRDDGLIRCIDITTGRIVWAEAYEPIPAGRARLADQWVLYHTVEDGRNILHLLDAATGKRVGRIDTTETRPVEDVFATLSGQVGVVTSQSIASFDADTAQRRWRVKLDGYLRRASLILDIDAAYYSDDGRVLKKLDLEEGRLLWLTEWLVSHSEDGLTTQLLDGSVIVSTTSSVQAVDAVTGVILWRGTTTERPRFEQRIVTRSYVAAVDIPDELRDMEGTAYFYDHRNASGVLPRDGGLLKLVRLNDARRILATDGGLLIQNGSTVHAWTSE